MEDSKSKLIEALKKLLESPDYIKKLLSEGKSLDRINEKRKQLGLNPLEFIKKK